MANAVWSDNTDDKLYLQSGEFSSTIKDSQSLLNVDTVVTDVSFDGTNTPWSGTQAEKLYLQSGLLTGTLKTSLSLGQAGASGISWDGTNTPWCGLQSAFPGTPNNKTMLVVQSGQFTSTVKTSIQVSNITGRNQAHGISFDGDHTPWADKGSSGRKLLLTSGQFTTTLKDSLSTAGVDTNSPSGIGFTGSNTLWVGEGADKLYLQSGEFSSTLKTSVVVPGGLGAHQPTGVETDDVSARLSGTAFGNPDTTISVLSIIHSRRRRV